ncbi:nuclear transport factor 2 family protein [Rhodococcus sp. B10]|uniref:nuclear transport factor 2 family protein n=1 Tax=Rhodococcus sp. B10 TaxID=2695876 RepID=UPI0014309D78|nr:nuclear transport factor 2 family protein [Rhodococcus sp. B10]NIL77279.1 hypothetical protein [Rhodococcus sp. B10]
MSTTVSSTEPALIKLAVRETIENYLNFLDNQDWDGIASCFTDDSESRYNHEEQVLHGGRGVANWLHRLQAYTGTDHALSNLHIDIDGDIARCDSRVIATVHWGDNGVGRASARAIRYRDELVQVDGTWRIRTRLHEPKWQYEALSAPLHLR